MDDHEYRKSGMPLKFGAHSMMWWGVDNFVKNSSFLDEFVNLRIFKCRRLARSA
jgi:hypothetical protein